MSEPGSTDRDPQASALDAIAEEFIAQLRAGADPQVEDYVARHPAMDDRLREMLSTVEILERLKPGQQRSSASAARAGEPSIPTSIGRDYRIDGELGRGGMGIVYEATQLSLGRRVALKVLPAGVSENAVERFRREARAAARLHHPGIVPIFDVGSVDGVDYYAMQRIDGRALDQVIADERQRRSRQVAVPRSRGSKSSNTRQGDSRAVAQLGMQAAQALHHAHECGVVHRDVKPSNLLLDDDGVLWVTDFGLAMTADEGLTMTGDVVGTLRYMAPERFDGHCDGRADVFALGATLYELLVLQPAFPSPDRLRLVESLRKDDPLPLRRLDSSVPADLETVVLKAMEKDPRQRYATASALAEDLGRFAAGQPILARPVSSLGRLRRWAMQNRAAAVSLTLLFGVLSLTAVAASIAAARMGRLAADAASARDATERQLYRSQIRGASDALAKNRVRLARQLLQETPPHLRGWEWRHLHRSLDRSLPSPLPASLRVLNARFAPDGRTALLGCRDGDEQAWRLLDCDSGTVRLSIPTTTLDAVWAPSHQQLFVRRGGGGLERWETRSGGVVDTDAVPLTGFYSVVHLGQRYAVLTDEGIELRRIEDDEVVRRSTVRPGAIIGTADGGLLLAAKGSRVAVYDAKTLAPISGLGIETSSGTVIGMSLGLLATSGTAVLALNLSSGDIDVLNVDPAQLARRWTLGDASGAPSSILVGSEGRRLIAGTAEGTIEAWDLATGIKEQQFAAHDAAVTGLAIVPGSGELLSCSAEGEHRCWPLDAVDRAVLRGHRSYVYPASFAPDGRTVVSGGWDGARGVAGALKFWDAATGTAFAEYGDVGDVVVDAVFLPDGARVAVSFFVPLRDRPHRVDVLDPWTGRVHQSIEAHGEDYTSRVVAHPDGRRLLTMSSWGEARLWDLPSGACEWTHSFGLRTQSAACAIAPDGRTMAFADGDGRIHLVDTVTHKARLKWSAHGAKIHGLAYSVDGSSLYSASADATVGVWDAQHGSTRARLVGHGREVFCIAASPDGTRIATGGGDGDLLIWDAAQNDLVARLVGHRDYIYSVDWSADGASLVTGSGDGDVRCWRVASRLDAVRAERQRADDLRTVTAHVDAAVAHGASPDAAAAALRTDPALSDRERGRALQVLVGRLR